MVFEIKFDSELNESNFVDQFLSLMPEIIAYFFSFSMLAIMWVNHHSLMNSIKGIDKKLIWLNMKLLFWMSMIPFSTHMLGSSPFLKYSSLIYGGTFFLSAFTFSLMRHHLSKGHLLVDINHKQYHRKISIKNSIAMSIYFVGAIGSLLSPIVSFTAFIVVPILYIIPLNKNQYE